MRSSFQKLRRFAPVLIVLSMLYSCDSGLRDGVEGERTLYTSSGGKIKTLDPALASDMGSAKMIASLYDTLLQYDYTARPYKLAPSMLAEMPKLNDDLTEYNFRLRDDLYFQADPCFGERNTDGRKITSKDVVFSLLRILDPRVHSSGFWLFRGKIKGMKVFRDLCSEAKPGDFSPYDKGCEGFEIIDDLNFRIKLSKSDPRLLYALAMAYSSVVPREALERYGEDFIEHPVGSGPFKMVEWIRDYRMIMVRNEKYRRELFPQAANPADRTRALPLLDKVVCYLVKKPLASWLLFLQGEMDLTALDKDNFQSVVGNDLKLASSLAKRGIKLIEIPEFRINYVGFCFTDPLLGKNLELRKAISLAYDVALRVKHQDNRIKPANGPIPPGVPGYDSNYRNPYAAKDLEKAKDYLAKAGFPGGIDPKTGTALELSFDLGRTDAAQRQQAELMVDDMKKIGIKIKPALNNWPRFLQKSRQGQMQLYKVAWIGDYPDAENFLQLFYGPNSGSCNRSYYRDPVFDKMFEEIGAMPDCPERTEKYRKMSLYLTEKCPWIFESYQISYRLLHSWLENYMPHDFVFSNWKYLSLNPKSRTEARKDFKPLDMRELRGDN